MSGIKKSKNSEFKLKRIVLTIFGIAVMLSAVALVCIVVKGDFSFSDKWKSKDEAQLNTENSIVYKEGLTFAPTKEDKSNKKDNDATELVEDVQNDNNSNAPVTNKQNSYENTLSDSSNWTTEQIILKAKDAVNKTKAYTGNLTVNHSETFNANVTECSAGGIIRSVVDLMIGWVVKPVEEMLVYQNGKAVNSEGETVPIILPKRNNFSLSESGVQSATVQQTENEYIIKIKLVEESVGMYEVPKHNAGAVGYLDVASFDISFMEVDSADIVYKGSSIELRINADGFVTYANYKIPLHIEGSAHKGSISGSATFEGEQTEMWVLNY